MTTEKSFTKGYTHETININLRDKPDWFFEKNPFGLVPVLETPAGEVIYESPITCEYLDEAYPGKKLLPSSPYGKAQQKMMPEHFSKITPYVYKFTSWKRSGKDPSKLGAEVKQKFVKLNEYLVRKRTRFFGGDSITMIDYMMWPWFERLEVFRLQRSVLAKATFHIQKFNMPTAKCFAKGSPAPGPVHEGNIRLYSMRFCPYAQRTDLVLHFKGIKHDTMNIDLKEKPEWYLEKNPFGLVPALETPAGEVIYDSPITCDYLEEVYPEKKLLPSSPYGKAKQRMMLEHFSKIVSCLYKMLYGSYNGEDVSGAEAEAKKGFAKLNEDLIKKKTKFFDGDSITMIDYMMWPFFERLEVFGLKIECLDSTPELKKWTERMLEDPAVRATMLNMEAHKIFYKSYFDGNPDFDYGL